MRIIFLILFLILKFQLLFLFYLNFINSPVKTLKAKVINEYKKKNYYVLKLKNREVTFYTVNRDDLKNLINDTVEVKIFTKDISFLGYLTKFYATSFDLKLMPLSSIDAYIETQHKDRKISNLFRALFLGESMDYETRQKLSTLGISHLFALSGLHLGFISAFLYFLFLPVYSFFHKKFSYRNRFIDIGILVLAVEFLYLYFTSFPPSLIRAFLMEVILFVVAFSLQNILSVRVLVLTVLFSLVFFTFSVFSIGFLLSITGVYYIYLFFRYYKPTLLNALFLSFYMFSVMFVWGHYFFGNMNNFQLLSPLVNLIFPIFYGAEIILHLIGFGGLLDNLIQKYLTLGENFYIVKISFLFLAFFAALSVLAYKKKWAFYGINLLAVFVILGSLR
ncbi:ComEC/Rec2 family competence protein [Caminibacter sp.]